MKWNIGIFDFNKIVRSISSNKEIATLLFVGFIIFFSWFTYGKALDYYFWRDDTYEVWMAKFMPSKLFSFDADAVARGKFGALALDFVFFKVLGFESYNWQLAGLIIKIINSFLLFFFVKELFRSLKIAVISSLLASSFIGGLEAYSWVRGIGVMIAFSLLAFIFYVASYYKKRKSFFFISLIFSFLVVFIFPAKGLAIVILMAIWELLMLISKKHKIGIKNSFLRLIALIFSQYILIRLISFFAGKGRGTFLGSDIHWFLAPALRGVNIDRFLTSLGNLFREPFLFTFEQGGLSSGDILSLILGILFFVVLAVLGIWFLINRENKLVPWLVVFLWIPFFYGPNWLYESSLIVAASHRYLAYSAILVPILWTGAIAFTRKTGLVVIFFFAILILNIRYAERVVNHDYLIRGKEAVLPLLDKFVSSIPIGETKSVINISGEHYLRGYVFDWSGPWSYVYLRGIRKYEDFPIFVDFKRGGSLMCDPKTEIIDWKNGGLMVANQTSTLDKVHGFYVNNNGILEDTTEQVKFGIAKEASCLSKKQTMKVSPGLFIKTTTFINNLDGKSDGKIGLIISWERPFSYQDEDFSFVIFLTDKKTSETLDVKYGTVKFVKGVSEVQTTIPFSSIESSDIEAKIGACQQSCDFSRITNGIIRLSL